jgi:apolipoprotein N-acyltransferase
LSRLRPRWEAPLLAAAGALQTLAFVHTALWPLPLLGAALLAWRLAAAPSAGRAAWLGWCYGWAWLVAGTWWLFISMHRYGHLPAWMAAAAVALLAALLSLYLAAAAALFRRWRSGTAADVPLFAALWLLAELARGVIFTGFPWVASGYAQVDAPLAVLAPWVGVYGIGAARCGAVGGAGAAGARTPGRPGGRRCRAGRAGAGRPRPAHTSPAAT